MTQTLLGSLGKSHLLNLSKKIPFIEFIQIGSVATRANSHAIPIQHTHAVHEFMLVAKSPIVERPTCRFHTDAGNTVDISF